MDITEGGITIIFKTALMRWLYSYLPCPELDPWNLRDGGKEWTPATVLRPPHVHHATCMHVFIYIYTHHVNKCQKVARFLNIGNYF